MIFLTVAIMYLYIFCFFFFLIIRPPPRSTRTDTPFPYTTLFRSQHAAREKRLLNPPPLIWTFDYLSPLAVLGRLAQHQPHPLRKAQAIRPTMKPDGANPMLCNHRMSRLTTNCS